ncbi:hypothetical protein J2W32_000938 [Variovorax boronicumulans]|uniref:Uncharacterized protein n=1 Tax=Variovorax boronicumulans TaxID=436515 RepID=A0AAW8CY47_9BURK|nr:hypothetical protein [Variovorax boronicumulans]MDP9892617.1 hypothetical protein [Variovorax boronicumulans]MDQ0051902.1 hypothetical protein [Variovorax boronicumulans]
MKEIRLGWSLEVSHLKHQIQAAASWKPETPALRRDLEIMAEVGNEVFGEGTHWIEERMGPTKPE